MSWRFSNTLRLATLVRLGTILLVAAWGEGALSDDGPKDRRPAAKPLAGVERVVFVGDSITYAGRYLEYVEAILRIHDPSIECRFFNLGLPSETVSGLTEPGHADGKFPRPDLHERFERVLQRVRPQLVVACYGMNDGIYHPYSDERFAKYRTGIESLRSKALAAGARVIHLTPPVFDPVPILDRTLRAGLDEYRKPFVGYDDVLSLYSAWLIARRGNGWEVVDIHGPMRTALDARRATDPKFRFAEDGVHADSAGHWLIARQFLAHWGIDSKDLRETRSGEEYLASIPHGKEILSLVERGQRVRKEAYLRGIGHLRPGMARGVEISEAERVSSAVDTEIRTLLNSPKK
jgi:lysophospholipase L1-like esterase